MHEITGWLSLSDGPVLYQVEHGHEVSWLSELREVCVLFINLDPGKALDAAETLYLLQTSFDVIYPCLQKFEGEN